MYPTEAREVSLTAEVTQYKEGVLLFELPWKVVCELLQWPARKNKCLYTITVYAGFK